MDLLRGLLLSLLLASLPGIGLAADERPAPKSPLDPVAALDEFRLHPGFRIELAAAEPQVVDPVAVRFDADGRMWVVEMGDYPNGPAKGETPRSRVRWLEDTDGDGRYETSRVFADGLLYATGLQPWADGVLVTVAGAVLYLRDTDGDGVADKQETWYTGFRQDNPQLRANHPTFALDNRVYVANGLRGGDVTARRAVLAGKVVPVSISGRDFRFDPLSGVFEAVNGNGQFGMTFDDFGRRFVCSNRNPCRHIVLEGRYLKRNPHLAVSATMHDVVTPGARSHVFPISRTWLTSTLHEGQFTAACAVTIYRGALFGKPFSGNVFICDPTGNLVHREVLRAGGATFSGRPGRARIEFLASRDPWFRAVNLQVGPDGALYVVDMYRAVVEHPQWVPAELKNRPDNYAGNDRGRIYRIVPADHVVGSRDSTAPQLKTAPPSKLVASLGHPNAWHRQTAARLIYQGQDRKLVKPLEALVRDGETPLVVVHALWALEGLQSLSIATLKTALSSDHPRVVEAALVLSERRLPDEPDLLSRVQPKTLGDPRLRFQYLLSLGAHPNWAKLETALPLMETAIDVWQGLAAETWSREALLSTAGRHGLLLLAGTWSRAHDKTLDKTGKPDFDRLRPLVRLICDGLGSRYDKKEVADAIEFLGPDNLFGRSPDWWRVQVAGLQGLDTGLRRKGKSLQRPFPPFAEVHLPSMWRTLVGFVDQPQQGSVGAALRRETMLLLRSGPEKIVLDTLIRGFDRGEPGALEALGGFASPRIGPAVLKKYPGLKAARRRAALDVLLARADRSGLLLDAIHNGRVPRADLDPSRVKRLREHADKPVRERAIKVLAGLVPAARKKVLADYAAAATAVGDPRRGREVFRKHCTACHRVDRIGVDVAPDIGDSRTRTRRQLLVSILDPNRAVDSNYFSYTLVTNSGKVLTGVLAAETPTAVTLRQPEGKQARVLRSEIDQLKSNGISLMPVGLEKNIAPDRMADLLSFLKNWRYLDGRVPIRVPGTSRN